MNRTAYLRQSAPLRSRRGLLQAGSLSAVGLTLPRLLRAAEPAARPKAKSCILFFMEGGPSHIDLWDMKPEAPEQIRGPLRPIQTSLPGFDVCEYLPKLAQISHRLTVVRSVTHRIVDHNAASYYILCGHTPLRDGQLIRGPSPFNAPPYGSVLAKLRPIDEPLPAYVHVPKQFFNCGDFIPGVLGGFLGSAYDPFIPGDPSQPDYHVPGLEDRLPAAQFDRRRELWQTLDHSLATFGKRAAAGRLDRFYTRAFDLITSPQARRAFRLDEEPPAVRERYGLPSPVSGVRGNGMPHLGQSLLLARRLVEAGVRLISVWAGGQAFDGHQNHFPSLKTGLCPPTDLAISGLIEDLAERGLLDETLFVALAEFGRTPKLGQITSTAGANADGRDHWPHVYTAFFAGAGVQPGVVYGASDALGSQPAENPVTPEDIAATIYHLMGLDPESRLIDHLNRPHALSVGEPIRGILT
ncbi:MAG: DUF1501 domain-containing protein [Planctomycetaceae bacterium]